MRPIYENAETLRLERATADYLEERLGGQLIKMPMKLSLDFLVMKDGAGVAFVEVRNRSNAMRQYPTYMLSLYKVLAASSLTQATGLPSFLAVQWTDACGIVKLPPMDGMAVGYGGHNSRNDPQDMEPMCYIEIDRFEVV